MDSFSNDIGQITRFNERPIIIQFISLIGLFIAGMLLGSVLGIAILFPFYGTAIKEVLGVGEGETNYNALRVMQMIATITTFAVPAFVLSKLKTDDYWKFLKPERDFNAQNFIWLPMLLILIYPFIGLSYEWNQALSFPEGLSGLETWLAEKEAQAMELIKGFLYTTHLSTFFLNFIMIGILPAICEELFFRGGMQNLLSKKNNHHFAIWVSAFIFSAIHMQFYGFLPRFILGLFLGYTYQWTKNIWVPILLHLINNGSQVILMYLGQLGLIDISVDSELDAPLGLTLGATVLFTITCYYFYQMNQQQNQASHG